MSGAMKVWENVALDQGYCDKNRNILRLGNSESKAKYKLFLSTGFQRGILSTQ
jgi:hypothetical protein